MQPQRRLVLVALAASIASVTWGRPAAANGRFPQASQIVFSPAGPATIVMRTTFGLLVSHDHGASWRWICEAAIGLGGAQEDPCYGVTQGGAIVGGLWQGLAVSPDTGCNWAFAGGALAHQVVVDLAVRPDDRRAVIAITGTWTPGAAPDAASTDSYDSQVFTTADDGAHWSARGAALDPTVKVTTIEVAKSDPHRIYVSTTRGSGAGRTGQLLVSYDDGASWTERAIPLVAGVETAAYVGAVDPANADLVYLRTDVHSRLLVTSDAGKTFAAASFAGGDGGASTSLEGYMFGFALSPDGATIYAGGVGNDGLFVGARGALTLVRRSGVHVECLAARDGELWACSDEASGFLAGVSTDDGATFAAKLHMTGVDGVLACPTSATVAQCQAAYPAQCARLGGCATSDPGDANAGAPIDASVPVSSSGAASAPASDGARAGCSTGGGGASAGGVAAFITALVFARRRRRKIRTNGRAES